MRDETVAVPIMRSERVAIIDAADLACVERYRWRLDWKGYALALVYDPQTGGARSLRMHRLILGLMKGGPSVDHRDGDILNNTRANLRLATPAQNAQNAKRRRGIASQFKGVFFRRARGTWEARITVNYRQIFLGSFASELEAAMAYDTAAVEHFGEFARPNIIPRVSQ